MQQVLINLALACLFAAGGYLARSLSVNGAIAAATLGTLVLTLGGWPWAILLIVFFLSSSFLTKLLARMHSDRSGYVAKGDRRDAGQVLANGGAAVLCAVLQEGVLSADWAWLMYAASLAAVTADTWATEVGSIARTPPRLITDLRRSVQPGTSGGITWEGTSAALAGAALIAWVARILAPATAQRWVWAILVGGFLGSAFDSWLGATVQGVYVCSRDGEQTEQHPVHRCGAPTTLSRGWRWLNNDWVNVACSTSGILMSLLAALALGAS